MKLVHLPFDRWAVTFDTARRGLGGATAHPVPSLLYHMYEQHTYERPVYQITNDRIAV